MENIIHIHVKKEQHLNCAEIFGPNSDKKLDEMVKRLNARDIPETKPALLVDYAEKCEPFEYQCPSPRPMKASSEFEIGKSDIQIFVPPYIDEKILSTARERFKNMITHHKASVCNQRFHQKICY